MIEFIQKTEHRAIQKTDKYSQSTERGRHKTLEGLNAHKCKQWQTQLTEQSRLWRVRTPKITLCFKKRGERVNMKLECWQSKTQKRLARCQDTSPHAPNEMPWNPSSVSSGFTVETSVLLLPMEVREGLLDRREERKPSPARECIRISYQKKYLHSTTECGS
jgi:hypothetical protein